MTFSLGNLPAGGLADAMNYVVKNMRSNVTNTRIESSEEDAQLRHLMEDFDSDKNSKLASIQLEYTQGTPCEVVDGEIGQVFDRRSTTVEITCGRIDSILEIREDRTCHYYIKVSSAALCNYDGFAPNDTKYSRVSFYPNSPIDPDIETE